jgi:hypothetical protein
MTIAALIGIIIGFCGGFYAGWYASRRNTVILTEETINQGLTSAKNSAKKRMEQHQADFDKKMDDMMAGVRVQLGQKLGIDNPQPKVHTNTQSDDSVIITREDRPL